MEYNAVGVTKDAVRAVFKNPEVDNLFDRNWHKIALSVEAKAVSLFLDCKHIQTLPIEEREDMDIQGKTVIGKRLYDSVPIDVSAPPPRCRGSGLFPEELCCFLECDGFIRWCPPAPAVRPPEDDDLLRLQARGAGDLLRHPQRPRESEECTTR